MMGVAWRKRGRGSSAKWREDKGEKGKAGNGME